MKKQIFFTLSFIAVSLAPVMAAQVGFSVKGPEGVSIYVQMHEHPLRIFGPLKAGLITWFQISGPIGPGFTPSVFLGDPSHGGFSKGVVSFKSPTKAEIMHGKLILPMGCIALRNNESNIISLDYQQQFPSNFRIVSRQLLKGTNHTLKNMLSL